ncbi:RNA-binding domain-containing protein [Calditerrivibrio nitroreducens]|uniref:Putative transcriptional regulator n=1 Tax=Calditerrivibrio nitroreducens (strain DSM 19672 / NBRC 101217 / Yu37-1) TaxID=768670 RepID=E4TFM1_CALNY|nr:RNA-binding domain-containing protein [Calditerrivibrio nitroreducens]ADR18489.1 putative transcriptional regulator [Calditerrivibrio nitroreducens DSM 19672]
MRLDEIIKQPENRKLEFKESLPNKIDLCKTIVSFANDAGGEIYIGVKNNPREIIGVPEEELLEIEETITNIISDNCYPIILPEISFINHDGKYVVVVKIYKGNNPPYYLKSKGKENGTYIRVGSSNRLANKDIIDELERQKQGISFDSLPVYSKSIDVLDISLFTKQFEEITGEKLTTIILNKLNLIVSDQNKQFPTNALILLSNDEIRNKLFPYAKIECARFKGTIPGDFIDQKSIDEPLSFQAEEAYKFVLRHISQGSYYEGVYRKDRWEYPIIAIREVIRNAVIHRDYSLSGKDIKIAIFDDKIEITSPGKLMPTIDFDDMESGQSDIRNKVLAQAFKKLGIIEQWGNGLRLIAEDLKKYPEIKFEWSEPGISFRVTFRKLNYKPDIKKADLVKSATDYDRLRPIATDYDQLSIEESKILLYLLDNKKITKREAAELINAKETKTKEVLKGLVQKGLIQRKGKGRSVYYVLNEEKR